MSAAYFETVKSFADVPIHEEGTGVETTAFLETADGLVNMFDLLGSGVFGFVQTDIRNNIRGVRNYHSGALESSNTLQDLVKHEWSDKTQQPAKPREGTACLVRLTRGLAFTCKALQHMQQDTSCELHVCFKRSYDTVLRHHHSFVVRSVVSFAIRAVPRRDVFYHQLTQGGSREKFDYELAKWLEGLDDIVRIISSFLAEGGYGRV